ncbi:HD domain-containing protein, partial [Planctomycetota bacterium]
LRREGGDPRVVIAAGLLHDIGIHEAERVHGSASAKFQEQEGPPIARRIMEKIGFDEETIEHVCRIVGSHHTGGDIDTPEFRIVWDADLIVNMRKKDGSVSAAGLEKYKTKAGRERATVLAS